MIWEGQSRSHSLNNLLLSTLDISEKSFFHDFSLVSKNNSKSGGNQFWSK